MRAEIVAVGTEILLGEIVDTNSAYIAQQLPELGIDLLFKTVVGDNLDRVAGTFRRGWERSDLIIVTGGLGPTEDDLTREAIASMLDETPAVDPALETHLRSLWERRNQTMPPSNIKQAWLIPSARALDNPRGTAPGWWVERNAKVIVCMPGVPTEMERMWLHEVRPELERRSSGTVLVTRTLKTVGLGESTVDEMLRHLYTAPGVGVGTYARADGVQVRIGAKAETREAAWRLIHPVEVEMERLLGSALWGRDDDTLEGAIGGELITKRKSLAVMESCTGGLVASTVTDVPGASEYFRGGLVTYQTAQKVAAGVPAEVIARYGVVSPETATAMADTARRVLVADYGVGVTGVLGPDPQDGVAPGTIHLACVGPDGRTEAATITLNQGRAAMKRRTVTTALMLIRRTITASG